MKTFEVRLNIVNQPIDLWMKKSCFLLIVQSHDNLQAFRQNKTFCIFFMKSKWHKSFIKHSLNLEIHFYNKRKTFFPLRILKKRKK
jgi:hypothetical protein